VWSVNWEDRGRGRRFSCRRFCGQICPSFHQRSTSPPSLPALDAPELLIGPSLVSSRSSHAPLSSTSNRHRLSLI
jgi:hypothetical protein